MHPARVEPPLECPREELLCVVLAPTLHQQEQLGPRRPYTCVRQSSEPAIFRIRVDGCYAARGRIIRIEGGGSTKLSVTRCLVSRLVETHLVQPTHLRYPRWRCPIRGVVHNQEPLERWVWREIPFLVDNTSNPPGS